MAKDIKFDIEARDGLKTWCGCIGQMQVKVTFRSQKDVNVNYWVKSFLAPPSR